jgi:hypothetical protein
MSKVARQMWSPTTTGLGTLYRAGMTSVVLHCLFMQQNQRKKVLMPLPIIDAIRLSYLHRHTAARAGVAIAGNYNRLSSSSFHLAAHPISVMNRRDGARKRRIRFPRRGRETLRY